MPSLPPWCYVPVHELQAAHAGRPGGGRVPVVPGAGLRTDHHRRHRGAGRGRAAVVLPLLPVQGGRGLPRPRALPGRHDGLPRLRRRRARTRTSGLRRGPARAADVQREPDLLRAALPPHQEGAGAARVRAVGGVALRARPRRLSARALRRPARRHPAGGRDRGRRGRGAQQRPAFLAAFGRAARRGCRGGPRPGVCAVRLRTPPELPVVEQRPEDVVVVVSRRGVPLWRVVQEVETALGRS